MNTGNREGATERRAKELLSALVATCPERVWNELNFELEQEGGAGEKTWKWGGRRMLVVMITLAGAAAVCIIIWRLYASGKSEPAQHGNAAQQQIKAPAPTPAPPIPAPKPIETVSQPPVVRDTVVAAPSVAARDTLHQRANLAPLPKTDTTRTRTAAIKDTAEVNARERRRQAERQTKLNALRARRARRAAINDSLNKAYSHMVNKEPFPSDTTH